MFGVKDKVLLKKRQGLFIQRTGLWKGMTRSFHKAFQGSRLKGSPKRYFNLGRCVNVCFTDCLLKQDVRIEYYSLVFGKFRIVLTLSVVLSFVFC